MSTVYTRICPLRLMLACVMAITMMSLISPLHAQGTRATTSRPGNSVSAHIDSSPTAMTAAAVWAKADTGRMMPGYQDFSRYDTPGYCLAAIEGMEKFTWRRGEADTLPKGTMLDTLPTTARDVGRACLAKMSPQTVAPMELYNLMRLAVRLGDTTLARQTIDYQLSLTSNDARAQGYVLVDATVEAARSHPIQPAFIESLLPRLATLGNEAAGAGAEAYRAAYQAAAIRFDTAAMLRFSHAREALVKRLTPEERKAQDVELGGVFLDSVSIVTYQDVPSLPQVVKRLSDQYAAARGLTDDPFAQAVLHVRVMVAELLGQPAPTLQVFKRYPAEAPFKPTPSKVTIVQYLDHLGSGRLDGTLARLRRAYNRYHDRGLEVVLVQSTRGYAWGSPPLTSEEEAKVIGWYYREYLKLPFPVFVEETSFSTEPDGRRVPAPSAFSQLFGPVRFVGSSYIIGRNGTVKAFTPNSEASLEAYILRELAAPMLTGG